MTLIDSNITLGQLVSERPELATRLDQMGVDYCCGGKRSVASAIADAGLDLETTMATLNAIPTVTRDAQWEGIDGLVDHIETTHHAYLRDSLPRLVALADKVAKVHGGRHPELPDVAEFVHALQADLEPHLLDEEATLFPRIRALATAAAASSLPGRRVSTSIDGMVHEHEQIGDLLTRLRRRSADYRVPDDGCASYRALYDGLVELEADIHLHVHKENNLLFPAAIVAENALTGHDPVVVDLGSAPTGSGGAVWSLPHGGDLDANLVRLDAGEGIGDHVNNDVDVLLFVQSGSGRLIIDGAATTLGADHLALIPRTTTRSIAAGPSGITYLSVHRRRGPLGIGTKR